MMKIVGFATLLITAQATHFFGYEMPNLEYIEESRGPGMPFLHSDPKVLLGCSSLSDDTEHRCHHKNIQLQATHAGRVVTDVPIYAILT